MGGRQRREKTRGRGRKRERAVCVTRGDAEGPQRRGQDAVRIKEKSTNEFQQTTKAAKATIGW